MNKTVSENISKAIFTKHRITRPLQQLRKKLRIEVKEYYACLHSRNILNDRSNSRVEEEGRFQTLSVAENLNGEMAIGAKWYSYVRQSYFKNED